MTDSKWYYGTEYMPLSFGLPSSTRGLSATLPSGSFILSLSVKMLSVGLCHRSNGSIAKEQDTHAVNQPAVPSALEVEV